MSDPIDRIVKGAPPPDVSAEQLAANAKANAATSTPSVTAPIPPPAQSGNLHDPREAVPSSPPQIYLNLLILESSLRLQYISLRTRLRLHLMLFTCLIAWITGFTYLLFFRPREDGSGVGGSVYWIVETSEKLALCSGIVTLILFWATGMYDRGVRWPRKFVSITNRGLRGFNLKVVVVRGGFLHEVMSWLAVLDMAGWFREAKINFQFVPRDIENTGNKESHHWNAHAAKHGILEEDIAPGGDVIRVLLLPKPFSPDFREGWDTYRMEYWDRENTRRSQLRAAVRIRRREVAKREGGWFWWTGWRGWNNVRFNPFSTRKTRRQLELDKLAIREKISHESLKQKKQQRRESILRDGTASGTHSRSASVSRQNSRTSTPEPDSRPATNTKEGRTRRGSSASSASGRRPRKMLAAHEPSRLSATETLLYSDRDLSVPGAMSKRNSTISTCSSDSREGSFDARHYDESLRMQKIKQEPIFTSEIKQELEED
ncbi:hypothetical protein AC579_4123 [Pseudocercospora musae]|uniref:Spo7-like protein n=1 Tax=Pseudocercospora musae TaxID=113226 RepID=A0A139IE65_9PEZI|nr:hypothetical protein AC579_4123 [Pseudocercospora musae]